MSKTADLVLNTTTGKWEAIYDGKVLMASLNMRHIEATIRLGRCPKAVMLGVTAAKTVSPTSSDDAEQTEVLDDAVETITFDINERFEFISDYVDMVANRDRKSAIIVGEGGLGKSYTVMSRLRKNGFTDIADAEIGAKFIIGDRSTYAVVKGYSSPKGLFRTLYENRDRLVIFDDCDSILRDETASNLLKAALDSYDKRIVTWNAESFGESDLPKSFEFTGAVIFISNRAMRQIPQAIISRSAAVDVSMTRAEVISRMRQIVLEGEFMVDDLLEHKLEALEFIAEHVNNRQIRTINLRTLIGVVTNRRCKPHNWQRLSLAEMIAAV